MKPLAVKSLITISLLLALLIPVSMVSSLVDERKQRQSEVYTEMGRSWGGENTVFGGLCFYSPNGTDVPDKTEIEGKLTAETRQKGIFKIPFYTADLVVRGIYNRLPGGDNKKTLNLAIYNNLSMEIKNVRINNVDVPFSLRQNKSAPACVTICSLNSFKDIIGSGNNVITVSLTIKGINKLMFRQLSQKTDIKIKSNWTDPNFSGAILPSKRELDKDGFRAEWNLSNFLSSAEKSPLILNDNDSFGVSLFMPVNAYSLTDRSIKYAILFIGLTFLAFFLFEIFGQIKIHPFQYLLVGFALVIFYLILLSFSEFISFSFSYFIASAATILLIVLYSGKILMTRTRTYAMGGMLAVLYLFLYILLQLEQYSLLLGSVALFAVLAAVMYLTRDVNWYEIQEH